MEIPITKETIVNKVYHKSVKPYFLLMFDFPPELPYLHAIEKIKVSYHDIFILESYPRGKVDFDFLVFNDTGMELNPLHDYLKILFSFPLSESKFKTLESLYKLNRSVFFNELFALYYYGDFISSPNVASDVWAFYKEFFGGMDLGALFKFKALQPSAYVNAICLAFMRSLIKFKTGTFDKSAAFRGLVETFAQSKPKFLSNLRKDIDLYIDFKNLDKTELFWVKQILL